MDKSAPLSAPVERSVWSRAAAPLLGIGILLVLPTFFQAIGEPYYLRVATRILIFAIAASSLNLVLGYGGMISLGHAAFIGTGSYVVAILAWHFSNDAPLVIGPLTINGTMSAFVTWPLAIIVSAFCAFVIGLISLRTSGLSFIMITLAFAQMIYYYSISLQQYGGDDGLRMRSQSLLQGLDLSDRTVFYYFCLAAFLACLLLIYLLVRSRFGAVIQGVRQNETRMRAVGIEPFGYQLTCFVISGAIAGFAGVLLVNLDSFVSPADLSLARSSELVAMILVGGVGTLWGPLLGAATYILMQFVLGTLTTHWALYFGPALILIVLFARRGLVGLLQRRGTA